MFLESFCSSAELFNIQPGSTKNNSVFYIEYLEVSKESFPRGAPKIAR